jgi:hypothetical protein
MKHESHQLRLTIGGGLAIDCEKLLSHGLVLGLKPGSNFLGRKTVPEQPANTGFSGCEIERGCEEVYVSGGADSGW